MAGGEGAGYRGSVSESARTCLPLRPGLPEQRTGDYERHGTTSLFAALDIATGEVLGKCDRRHRHQEFLKFMQVVDSKLPADAGEIHLVLDNYGTHKTRAFVRWFARHPRYRLHFTPTSGPWVNQVERGFAERSRRSDFGVGRSAAFPAWRRQSRSIWNTIMNIRSLSHGRRTPI
jgi:transposase